MRYRILLFLWILTDLLLFVATYTLAYFLRVWWILSTDFPFSRFITVALMIAPIWVAVTASLRVYRMTRQQQTLDTGSRIVYSAIIALALFMLVYYFTYRHTFSRLLLIIAFVLHAACAWGWHIVYSHWQRMMLRRNPPTFPTLIVGVTRESRALIERLNRHRSPLKPVAIIDPMGIKETTIDGVPVRGRLNKLEDVLAEHQITHLIQCSDLEQSLNLLSACRNRGITYMLLPSVLGIVERDEQNESLEGMPVTVVRPTRNF